MFLILHGSAAADVQAGYVLLRGASPVPSRQPAVSGELHLNRKPPDILPEVVLFVPIFAAADRYFAHQSSHPLGSLR